MKATPRDRLSRCVATLSGLPVPERVITDSYPLLVTTDVPVLHEQTPQLTAWGECRCSCSGAGRYQPHLPLRWRGVATGHPLQPYTTQVWPSPSPGSVQLLLPRPRRAHRRALASLTKLGGGEWG